MLSPMTLSQFMSVWSRPAKPSGELFGEVRRRNPSDGSTSRFSLAQVLR
jgi:hypothetical protein